MKNSSSHEPVDPEALLVAVDSIQCRQLLDLLPVAIYTTDAHGRLTHFNKAAVAMSGRTPELDTDKWCVTWRLFYPDGRPMSHDQCPMAVALKEGRAVRGFHAMAERPDGTRFWFEPYPTPLFDADGQVTGGINLLLDITERKRAESQLAAEAESLGKLNELSSRLWRARGLREGLEEMLTATMELLGADFGNVQMLDSSRGVLLIETQHGFERPFLDFFREVSAGDDSVCGRALRTGERLIEEDVWTAAPFAPMRDIARTTGFRGVQSTPLIARDGAALGMLSTHWRRPHRPDEHALRRLDLYVRQAVDFIERKRVEEAQRAGERRYRHTLSLMPAAVYTCDSSGLITYFNEVAAKLWGRSPRVGDTDERFCGSEQMILPDGTPLPHDKCPMAVALTEGRTFRDAEVNIRRQDGSVVSVSVNIDPIRNEHGEVIGAINAFHDLSTIKKAERALRESEERFRMIADHMAQLAWTCDTLGSVTWYNKRWLEYTGLSFEEMKGWEWSKVQHPDHLDRVVATITRAAEKGEPWEDTFPLRAADGSYRWFLSRAVPIRDDRGNIARWFGTNTDVTKQREAEEALIEADRRKDEFLATLAHELRNPLAPIRNSLHILRMMGGDRDASTRVHDMMDRQVNHMVRLVDDLMEVSRITRGKIELRKEPVDIADIVRVALESSKPVIDAARHHITVTVPPKPILLNADPVRLAQVLTNLLNNAAKYTEDGGHIWLTVSFSEPNVVVSVRDTGIGISADMLPRIFDLFTQGDRTHNRAQGGLGIGLTLVRTLVSQHGGHIEARSEGPGRGSEFIIHIPSAADDLAGQTSGPRFGSLTAVAARRILVVDDNSDSAESLGLLLSLFGAEVRTADNGQTALQILETFRPSVAFLDIGMPGMDGHEVARQVRQRPEGREVTLVALTGWGQEDDRRRSRQAGFDHHLVKPVESAALQLLLKALPDSQRGRTGPETAALSSSPLIGIEAH